MQTGNIRNNRVSFIIILIGVFFFSACAYFCIKSAVDSEYIQIVFLALGCFFGVLTIIMIIVLCLFFGERDIMTYGWRINWGKWGIFRYLSSVVAATCFFFAAKTYLNRNHHPLYIEVAITQTNVSKIEKGAKGSRSIHIRSEEYPRFTFKAGRIAVKYIDQYYYLQHVMQGDTLIATIDRDDYHQKLIRTEPLHFIDKTVNYNFIPVYGLKHRDAELLSVSDYEFDAAKNNFYFFLFSVAGGVYFLWLQHKINNERRSGK